ncbi:MAG: hypothetical protein K6F82_03190 [Sphaerochaetaceae bacterium]|nr:hypothetical protein [Sphaerochaetaceae bacterium]
MSSSNQKSNIAGILTVVSILAVTALLILAFYDVFSGEMRTGKYMDPQVASTVVEGTVYDRDNRILAMEVPVYDVYINMEGIDNTKLDMLSQTLSFYTSYSQKQILNLCNKSETLKVYIDSYEDESYYSKMMDEITFYGLNNYIFTVKSSKRIYPAQFHMAQLLLEVEDTYSDILNPRPSYGEQITYGSDIQLTTDLDIQYFLDLAVQKVFSLQNPKMVVSFIMDMNTSEIMAISTYPFYDLNNSAFVDMTNYAFLNSFQCNGETYTPNVIKDVDTEEEYPYFNDSHEEVETIKNLYSSFTDESSSSMVLTLTGPNNSYVLFIGSVEPTQNEGKESLQEALAIVESGLIAQSKL